MQFKCIFPSEGSLNLKCKYLSFQNGWHQQNGINRMALHALTFFDRFLLASRLSIWLIKFFSWLRVMLTCFGILLSSCQKKMTLMQKNKEQKNYLLPIKWIHAWEYMKNTFMRITFFLVLLSHNLNEWMNDRKP